MSVTKKFYHNMDLLNVGQLIGARIHNVTTTARTTLGASLDASNEGLSVWDTDEKSKYTWDGVTWVRENTTIEGDVIFQNLVDASVATAPQVQAVKGYQYIVSVAGTLSMAGVTFLPSADVEIGDKFLFTDTDTVYVFPTKQPSVPVVPYVRQHTTTADLVAQTPLTVTHNLGLANKDAFTVNVMRDGSAISVDVDSVDVNSVTLTSLIAITGLTVTVQGA